MGCCMRSRGIAGRFDFRQIAGVQGLSDRKPVGTFAGKRKTRLVTVGRRLQWAPFQRTVPYSFLSPLQAWGARGRVFESLRPDHIIQRGREILSRDPFLF